MPARRADRDPDRGPSDAPRVFRTLNQHGVDYVVIGGWAVIAHGRVRTTLDVDFVADVEPANLERLADALAELRAELWGVDAHLLDIALDAETLASGANFTLTTDAGGVDFFNEVPGQVPYRDLRRRAVSGRARGVSVPLAGREDLIRMKRAAGRDRDLEDLAVLTRSEVLDEDEPDAGE